MKPLFTIQAGEFLVGDYLIRKYKKKIDIWIPASDRGIDLLVTPRNFSKKGIRIQVKSSRLYGSPYIPEEKLIGKGWYTIKTKELKNSETDFWVFVIMTMKQSQYFIIVPTKVLQLRLRKNSGKIAHMYLTVFDDGRCYDLRGLRKTETILSVYSKKIDPNRDYTKYLNEWKPMFKEIGIKS